MYIVSIINLFQFYIMSRVILLEVIKSKYLIKSVKLNIQILLYKKISTQSINTL